MKYRTITNQQDRDKAFKAIESLKYPYTLGVGHKKESEAQRSRYFALVDDWLDEVRKYINAASDSSGYTPFEVQEIISRELPFPQSGLMASLDKRTAHNIVKTVCGIPTSVGVGTKQFKKLETIMDATFAEILADVVNITRRMM